MCLLKCQLKGIKYPLFSCVLSVRYIMLLKIKIINYQLKDAVKNSFLHI